MSSKPQQPDAAAAPPRDRVVIFDTTLRDGEQSPGFSMNLGQKLRVARALQELGVDVIEAGFAAASPGDLEAIQAVSREIEGPVICSLSRCTRGDIEASWKALQDAPRRRCHVFLATSPIHRDFKLKMAKEEIVRRAVEGVKMARERFEDVEFSTEDAARTELEFLAEVVEAAIQAGATTLNIPDTVGYALPSTYAETLSYLKKNVRGIDHVVMSVHCHNDLGLAVANSLAGVQVGARQVECTVNGIGERAGNASLEEVVMALKTRGDVFHVRCGVHTEKLYPASKLVQQVTGRTPSPTRPGSTSTACSPTARPTRSCGPRRWGSPAPSSCSASTPGATPSRSASSSWGTGSGTTSSTRCSRTSSCWPTRRRRSTTPIWRPW
jgi:2-isopropylmalate synthase